MSYALTPILVDLEAIRGAVGCRDEALVDVIIRDIPEAIEHAAANDDASKIALGRAVRSLVMGEELDEDGASQYFHAFELICAHLGEVILPDAWGEVRWDALGDFGLEEVLEAGPPIAIPPDPFGPRAGFLAAADVSARLARLDDEPIADDDDPDLEELREEYEGWLREAASKGKAIVFFV